MKAVEYSYEAGDTRRAMQLGEEAVALAPGSRDRANALNILARVGLFGDFPLAIRLWEEALAEADIDAASDPFSMFSELNGRGRWRPGPGGAAGENKPENCRFHEQS